MSMQLAPSVWPWNCLQYPQDSRWSEAQPITLLKYKSHLSPPHRLTWQASDYGGPRRQCCHHYNRRSRPWHQGWWPEHSRLGLMRSAQPWCVASARPNPRWSGYLLHHPRSAYGRQATACRNGCSCPGSAPKNNRAVSQNKRNLHLMFDNVQINQEVTNWRTVPHKIQIPSHDSIRPKKNTCFR